MQLHVRSNLIVWHVAGAFYHNLYPLIPSALCQFTQVQQLLNLRSVGSISNASGTQAIAKADSYIIFGTNIKNFIIVFIQRILCFIVQHPAGDKAAAAADNIHLTAFVNECFQHIFVNAAMNGHEVGTICSLLADNIENIFLSHLNHCRGYSLNLAKLSYGYSPHYRVCMVEKSSPVGGASLAYI